MNRTTTDTASPDLAYRPGVLRLDDEMVELPLLLPHWQMESLETAARRQGLTTGQMLRRLISGWAAQAVNHESRAAAIACVN